MGNSHVDQEALSSSRLQQWEHYIEVISSA